MQPMKTAAHSAWLGNFLDSLGKLYVLYLPGRNGTHGPVLGETMNAIPVSRACGSMAACWGYGTHLPALRGCSLGFRATWQAILCLATGTGYSGGQRAGQAGAAVTWGRALVVATAQSAATWQVTWVAVALTASSSTLMPAAGLCIATAQLAPAHSNLLCCLEHLVFIGTTWRPCIGQAVHVTHFIA